MHPKKKKPNIKLVIKWSKVGERISCVENLYDESQLIMGGHRLSLYIHIINIKD